jgi:hypothetical protein
MSLQERNELALVALVIILATVLILKSCGGESRPATPARPAPSLSGVVAGTFFLLESRRLDRAPASRRIQP